ncbi:hypothetical protein ASPFODRAFT_194949 [Aspergillus luchuensis CBS 106.47]|uniref:Zn(2)-C6 fungal-type domain-containing protein n=1 Tax=Aspergillus luchuensis (strain CBS 106.47) TaxID=1137211 RepID=A0A1M3T9D8_ASPLC|nr:hypothetical protein ASPFODRAFT_194949 [Aspergillus luchuensis CBS 106.47]
MAAKRSFDQAGLGDEENRAVKRQSSEEQLQSSDDIFGNAGLDDAGVQDLYGDQAYLVNAIESTNRAQAGVFEEAELHQNLDPTYLPVVLKGMTADMMPTTSASMADNVSGLFEEPLSASEGVAGGNGDQTSLDEGVSASQVTSANGGPAESNNAPTEDAATAAATDVQVPQEEAPAPPKKRKGRPPGSRNTTTRASKKNKNKEGSSDNAGDDKDDKRDASLEMRQTYAMKIPAKPLKPGEPDDTDAEFSEFDEESDEESRNGKRTKRRRKSKRDPSRTTLACDLCKMRKAKCDKGLFGCSNCRNQNRICWVTDPIWLRTERRGALILMRRRIIHLEWLNNCLEQAARSLSSRVKALLQQLQKANITPVPEEPLAVDPTKLVIQQTIRYLKQSRKNPNNCDEYPSEFNTHGPGDLEDLITSPLDPYPEDHPERHPEFNTMGDASFDAYVSEGFEDPTGIKIKQNFVQQMARDSRAQAQGPSGPQHNGAMPGHVDNGTRPAHPTGRQQGTIQYPTTPPAAAYQGRYAQVNMGQLPKQAGLPQDPTYNTQLAAQLAASQFSSNFQPSTPYMPNQPFFAPPPGFQQQQKQQQQRHATAQPSNTIPAPPATESSTSTQFPRPENTNIQNNNPNNNNMYTQSTRQVHPNSLEDLARYQYQYQQQQQQQQQMAAPKQSQHTNYETLPQINTPGYSTHYPYAQQGQDDPQLATGPTYPDISDHALTQYLGPNEYDLYGPDAAAALAWASMPGGAAAAAAAYPHEGMSLVGGGGGVPSSSAGVSQPPTSTPTTTATATTAATTDNVPQKKAKRGGRRKKQQQQQQQ